MLEWMLRSLTAFDGEICFSANVRCHGNMLNTKYNRFWWAALRMKIIRYQICPTFFVPVSSGGCAAVSRIKSHEHDNQGAQGESGGNRAAGEGGRDRVGANRIPSRESGVPLIIWPSTVYYYRYIIKSTYYI